MTMEVFYQGNATMIHDADTCRCEHCRWANEAESHMLTQTRKDAINQQRRNLIEEIERMQAEVNRLDEEYDALEDADDR